VADVSVEPTIGKHDVYFVFRNPEAKEGQILMQMQGIKFRLGKEVM
jgi:hypothetical protein